MKKKAMPAWGNIVAKAVKTPEMDPDAPSDLPKYRKTWEYASEKNEAHAPEIRYKLVNPVTPSIEIIEPENEYRQPMLTRRWNGSWWEKEDRISDQFDDRVSADLSMMKYFSRVL